MGSAVLGVVKLNAGPWPTVDPFLFCAYHDDLYPAGNEAMGPDASLAGRQIGMDFAGLDGWRMYHGDVVPGFPAHPHRGFETITLVRKGVIDHSDSLGATARFGGGDVQWMTAGAGVVHSEMFPLRDRDADNPLELFQIWLNLPAADKMVPPYFTMLWNHTIPRQTFGEVGAQTEVVVVTGTLGDMRGPQTPPNSWAAREEAQVLVMTVEMDPHATWTLPAGSTEVTRALYFYKGGSMRIAGEKVASGHAVQVQPDQPITLQNGPEPAELLLLQGRPLGEPVAHHGPFVMNTAEEIHQAMADYRRTRFGGWPWDSDGPVHAREQGRFAIHADGRRDEPTG